MSDEAPPAPKPVAIGNVSEQSAPLVESGPVLTTQIEHQEEGQSPLAQAIERYESLKSNSGTGNNLSVVALILIVISLFIGFFALYDGIVNGGSGNGIETCFGGLFIGAALGAGSLAQFVSHEVQLKKALEEVKACANLPEGKATSSYQILGLVFCILGVIAQFLMPQTHPDGDEIHVEALVALMVGLIVLLAGILFPATSRNPENVLLAARAELLRRNKR